MPAHTYTPLQPGALPTATLSGTKNIKDQNALRDCLDAIFLFRTQYNHFVVSNIDRWNLTLICPLESILKTIFLTFFNHTIYISWSHSIWIKYTMFVSAIRDQTRLPTHTFNTELTDSCTSRDRLHRIFMVVNFKLMQNLHFLSSVHPNTAFKISFSSCPSINREFRSWKIS